MDFGTNTRAGLGKKPKGLAGAPSEQPGAAVSNLTRVEKRTLNQLAHAHAQIYEARAKFSLREELHRLKAEGLTEQAALSQLHKINPRISAP